MVTFRQVTFYAQKMMCNDRKYIHIYIYRYIHIYSIIIIYILILYVIITSTNLFIRIIILTK